jgi:hypothetical protein
MGSQAAAPNSGTSIRLARHIDYKTIYILDRSTGTYERRTSRNAWQDGACGVASELIIGLIPRETVLVALIADERSLWLRVGPQEYDLGDRAISVRKRWRGPFVRTLDVLSNESRVLRLRFWAELSLELLSDCHEDFARFVCDIASTREERLGALLRWNATAAGRDPSDPAVSKELERRLAELLRPGPESAPGRDPRQA